MEPRYVIILSTSPLNGEVLIIRLTDQQLAESEKFGDMESYLSTLEEEYHFNLSESVWNTTEELKIRKIGE